MAAIEAVIIALAAFAVGVLAGITFAGVWLGRIIDSLRRDMAVDIADEVANRQGYLKAHPKVEA